MMEEKYSLLDPQNANQDGIGNYVMADIEGQGQFIGLNYYTVAYWYQKEPSKPFPKIRPKEERQKRPAVGVVEIHRCLEAWRNSMGSGPLWGNEKKRR